MNIKYNEPLPIFHYKNHQLYYEQYGQGKQLLICLHGIADRGNLFKKITQVMWADYTVIAFDLPFHGVTVWQKDDYTDIEIAELIQLLLQQKNKSRFSLMVHSMGGRLVLGILPHLAHQIDSLYLFAPGGFQYVFTGSKFWWGLRLRKWIQRRFEQSEGFVKILKVVRKLNLLDPHLYSMLLQQLETPKRRGRLLKSWVSLYHFSMRLTTKHKKILNRHQIPVYFFYGNKDKITPARHVEKFVNNYALAELEIVEGNHFFVREALVAPFAIWYQTRKVK